MPAWCSIAARRDPRATRAAFLAGLAIFVLTAPPLPAQLPPSAGANPGGGLVENNQRVLPIAEAFPWYVGEAAPGRFRVAFHPAPEHYLYRHAFDFSLEIGDETQTLDFRLPPGLAKNDRFFGDIVAYYEPVTVELEISRDIAAGAALLIAFQGCADWGFCYPPQQARFEFPPR